MLERNGFFNPAQLCAGSRGAPALLALQLAAAGGDGEDAQLGALQVRLVQREQVRHEQAQSCDTLCSNAPGRASARADLRRRTATRRR